MVFVGSGSVSFNTDPYSGSDTANFLYGSGSRVMMQILRIRIRNTGTVLRYIYIVGLGGQLQNINIFIPEL